MTKLFGIVAAGLISGLAARGDQAITITQARPIEKMDAAGQVCGVSIASVGMTFSLVEAHAEILVLKDKDGIRYRIPAQATDYSAPAAVATGTNAGGVNPAPPTVAVARAESTNAVSSVKPADADMIGKLNAAFGVPLLADAQFWQDDVAEVAQRLHWPEESKTTLEESYRQYARAGEARIFGASAYSLALYGKQGKPTYLSIIFANAGDFAGAQKVKDSKDPVAVAAARRDLATAVKKDAEAIAGALTPILGEPSVTLFGNSSSNRDEVHRWDWNGVAILLNSHQGEYASIKIVPSEAADHFGKVEVTDRGELRDLLVKRVVKRDNGDVLISELPMVDQGPKGYCVPATWERYLRYMDVPADLYVLAIMGNSGLGGGTSYRAMQAGVTDYVSAYHRRIETYDAPLDVAHVAKYIDQGLPLMWTCWIAQPVEETTDLDTSKRKSETDWSAYKKTLVAQDAALGKNFHAEDADHANGHMRMIIGYNAVTDEIAISDSWGARMAERWMYVGTATKISQSEISYLSW